MSAQINRLGYAGCIAVLAVLLLLFGQPYLLCMLLLLLALGLMQVLGVRRDARRLHFVLHCGQGSRVGGQLELSLEADYRGRLWVAKYALLDLEISNTMMDIVRVQQVMVPLRSNGESVKLQVSANVCGAVAVRCRKVRVWDLLELSSAGAKPFEPGYTVIWPRRAEVILSQTLATVGASQSEGTMQNRRGNDQSEIFDFREYMPGDDVRSIHWKLSCKTDHLLLREASDPAHYEIILLADMGLARHSGKTTPEELNAAVSILIAMGRQLLAEGLRFCLAFPSRQGLVCRAVRTEEELRLELPSFLSEPLPAQAGMGLQLFRADHLEQNFTRLLIVSAGSYEQDLQSLQRMIGISVVSTAEQEQAAYTTLSPTCEMAVLPVQLPQEKRYRIIC